MPRATAHTCSRSRGGNIWCALIARWRIKRNRDTEEVNRVSSDDMKSREFFSIDARSDTGASSSLSSNSSRFSAMSATRLARCRAEQCRSREGQRITLHDGARGLSSRARCASFVQALKHLTRVLGFVLHTSAGSSRSTHKGFVRMKNRKLFFHAVHS